MSKKTKIADVSIPGRWANSLKPLLTRSSPLAGRAFEPDDPSDMENGELYNFLREDSKILCVGAGGLGCDILKCLALSGFRNIYVVDMDTIDATNLNRQFLFRASDVGASKSQAAARFINNRVAGANVKPFHGMMQDKDDDWYTKFAMVVCGLDSVKARRWINTTLFNLLSEAEDGKGYDLDTIIPFVDAGTEGWKGHCRVIFPGSTSCMECTLEMFPPAQKVPLCTVAATPRNAAHCIQYASFIAWDKDQPFKDEKGKVIKPDSDNPEHMKWLYEKAVEWADKYNIKGVTYKETLGVFKNIIPAIASTNALTAAVACNEALKLATDACAYLKNYMMYNGEEGIYTSTQELLKNPECSVCGNPEHKYAVADPSITLEELIAEMCKVPKFQFTQPGITGTEGDPIYLRGPAALERALRPNLEKPLTELMNSGDTWVWSDPTLPSCSLSITMTWD